MLARGVGVRGSYERALNRFFTRARRCGKTHRLRFDAARGNEENQPDSIVSHVRRFGLFVRRFNEWPWLKVARPVSREALLAARPPEWEPCQPFSQTPD